MWRGEMVNALFTNLEDTNLILTYAQPPDKPNLRLRESNNDQLKEAQQNYLVLMAVSGKVKRYFEIYQNLSLDQLVSPTIK